MHNRKKQVKPLTDIEIATLSKKCMMYESLVNILFERRDHKKEEYTLETLALTKKMLTNNPDFYTLWNFRREILYELYPSLRSSASPPSSSLVSSSSSSLASSTNEVEALLTSVTATTDASLSLSASTTIRHMHDSSKIRDEELELSTEGIKRNPKSYCAWHHRIWVMSHFEMDYSHELALCSQLLHEDQRNFHCWNYRRYVVHRASSPSSSSLLISSPPPPQPLSSSSSLTSSSLTPTTIIGARAELEYSYLKIQENFSNYSAFHHRSIYIKAKLSALYATTTSGTDSECSKHGREDTNNNNDDYSSSSIINQSTTTSSGSGSISSNSSSGSSNSSSNSSGNSVSDDRNSTSILQSILDPELLIVENAVFTEPDDQSAWWYHQFLLTWISTEVIALSSSLSSSSNRREESSTISDDRSIGGGNGGDSSNVSSSVNSGSSKSETSSTCDNNNNYILKWFASILKKQVEMMHSLLELEDNCRWIMNSIVFILNLLLSSSYHHILSEVEMDGDELLRRRDILLYRLIEVDPNHANRYHYLLKKTYN